MNALQSEENELIESEATCIDNFSQMIKFTCIKKQLA